jgi:hypothetical protein
MEHCLDLSKRSGIETYEIGETFISVKFKNSSKIYTYSYKLAGKINVDTMKTLAKNGKGLNGYITRNVRYLYDK